MFQPRPPPPAMAHAPARIGAPPSVASASAPTQTSSSATSQRPAPTNRSRSITRPAPFAALSHSFNKPQRASTPLTTKRTTPMPLKLFTPDMATLPTRPLRVTVRPDYRLSFNAEASRALQTAGIRSVRIFGDRTAKQVVLRPAPDDAPDGPPHHLRQT